jgi:hypothetical protein
VTKLGVQTTQSVDDHGRIRHRVSDITQEIGEVLEAGEVVVDGQFTLEETVEFLEGIGSVLICIV